MIEDELKASSKVTKTAQPIGWHERGSTAPSPDAGSPEAGGTVPAGFGALCSQSGVDCQTGTNPPNLVGQYQGNGTTEVTSNALWAVGAISEFVVQIVSQPGDGSIDGSAQIGSAHDAGASDAGPTSFTLQLTSAVVRGGGDEFTIYASDTEDTGDGCPHGVMAIISGTVAGATIRGTTALVFTTVAGSACTANEIANDPGTGATFRYETEGPDGS
jgi:hypothetical protein